ncbi:Alpha/Beta hydrolase protein [Lobosporangium transversale]|uniref:Alpha/Beta hydrolase protein n=1 Tax=Lobosporangium transversale TaxID=64571 RepID=A0A1Y2GG72_9FUNG|nr:Alpha/Beta hydrolase protein [Lobosporangium transversale]ORZ09978.1 Alpha/Beta hydrolase protein [Lobosporangium transversale]|eukprot:XP_021879068.1 Alpha/Beta hydrolase protein [Lobosporangium transversale]
MKFFTPSVVSFAATLLFSLSAIKVHSLPTGPTLEKHAIEGLNNYNCKLTPAHPRPVILLHGTGLNVYSWSLFAPEMAKRGYCVFALTYGRYIRFSGLGGMAPIEDSAREIGAFADEVMRKMNVSQVDIVGHSQGGILTRYWIKYLDGAGKVYRHVGVVSSHHGTTLYGIATLGTALGLSYLLQVFADLFAPSLFQQVMNSTFIQKLNAGGDTSPGVIESNIATKYVF